MLVFSFGFVHISIEYPIYLSSNSNMIGSLVSMVTCILHSLWNSPSLASSTSLDFTKAKVEVCLGFCGVRKGPDFHEHSLIHYLLSLLSFYLVLLLLWVVSVVCKNPWKVRLTCMNHFSLMFLTCVSH